MTFSSLSVWALPMPETKISIFSKPPQCPILSFWILNLHIIICQFQKRSTKKHFFSLSPCSCHMCTPQYQSRTNLSLVRLSSTSSSQHASCEDQLRRKMLEKIIRVDHAGEMWASFIYQGKDTRGLLQSTLSKTIPNRI